VIIVRGTTFRNYMLNEVPRSDYDVDL